MAMAQTLAAAAACSRSISFKVVLVGKSEWVSFRPSRIFGDAEVALRNDTAPAWERMKHWVTMLLGFFKWDFFAHSPSLKRCPFIALVPYVLGGMMASGSTLDLEIRPKAFLARAEVAADEIRHLTAEIGLDTWQAYFRTRYPKLEAAPARAYRLVGCELGTRVTLSTFAARGTTLHAEPSCIRGDAVLTSDLLSRNSYDASVPQSVAALLNARPVLEVRPLGPSANSMLSFIDRVLDAYMQDALGDLQGGLLLEFGVSSDALTLRRIVQSARAASHRIRQTRGDLERPWQYPRVVGFDSFIGLPRDWQSFKKGDFGSRKGVVFGSLPNISDLNDAMPEVQVDFVKGWFNETLPAFLTGMHVASNNPPTIALVHLDADLYESTTLVLEKLSPFLRDGTLLVMDDIICGLCSARPEPEIWEALADLMLAGKDTWPWDLEVLGAPWNLVLSEQTDDFRAVFRIRSRKFA